MDVQLVYEHGFKTITRTPMSNTYSNSQWDAISVKRKHWVWVRKHTFIANATLVAAAQGI